MIKQVHITPGAADLFEFDQGGRLANYVIARHEDWTYGDVVAWFPENPYYWWSYRGLFDLLGWPALNLLIQNGHPVPIYRTPKTWKAHSEHGVVALYWPLARITLADLTLIVEDLEHEAEIQWQFQRPRPRVLLRAPDGALV